MSTKDEKIVINFEEFASKEYLDKKTNDFFSSSPAFKKLMEDLSKT